MSYFGKNRSTDKGNRNHLLNLSHSCSPSSLMKGSEPKRYRIGSRANKPKRAQNRLKRWNEPWLTYEGLI